MIRLENILKMSWRHLCKMSYRCLEDIFKSSSKRLQDVVKMSQDVWKTFWRRLLKMYLWREYICLYQDVLKKSWRCFLKTNVCWDAILKAQAKDIKKRKSWLGRRKFKIKIIWTQKHCFVSLAHALKYTWLTITKTGVE